MYAIKHIKYDKKYQYDVHSADTLAGKNYVEYYRENYESWVKGRAKRSIDRAVKAKHKVDTIFGQHNTPLNSAAVK